MDSTSAEAKHLLAFIERIENVEQTIADEQEGRKEIYVEIKSVGYDAKIVRKIVALRKQDRDKRREEQEVMDLYLSAIGMEA